MDKVLHAPMPFTAGGQTINDRLTAAYHSLAGSQLGKTVCKATTEEVMGPKKKHLDYLLHCSHEPNVSIPQMANLLVERTQNTNWCVVYKALITIHNLMCYGNERFMQYLASSNVNFNLSNFLDKTSVQGYDMSTHIRRYAKYIGDKIYTYRLMAFDFCKVKRGRDDGLLRTMPIDKLMKTLPVLQGQIDSLLEFQVTPVDLTNGVINSCFILMFRDLIRLFACYNDSIINLLEKYFEMPKKQCREALDLYKKFLMRMDKVAEFLKVAEAVGIDRGEIPDLARAPSSLLEALEQHLAALEDAPKGYRRIASPTAVPPTGAPTKQESAYDAGLDLDPSTYQKYVDQERERLNFLKEQKLIRESGAAATASNPFVSSELSGTTGKEEDLLILNTSTNPFADSLVMEPQQPQLYHSLGWNQSVAGMPPYTVNGHSQPMMSTNFTSDEAFSRAFSQGKEMQTAPEEEDSTFARTTNPFLTEDNDDAYRPPPVQTPPQFAQEADRSWPADYRESTDGMRETPQFSGLRTSDSTAEVIAQLKQNAQALNSASGSRGKQPTMGTAVPKPQPHEMVPQRPTTVHPSSPHPPAPSSAAPATTVTAPIAVNLPRRPSLADSPTSSPGLPEVRGPPGGGQESVRPPSGTLGMSEMSNLTGEVYLDTPFSHLDASYSTASSPAVPHRQVVGDAVDGPSAFHAFKPIGAGEAYPTGPPPTDDSPGMDGWKKAPSSGLIAPSKEGKIDLESTIANLAQNLSIDRGSDGKSPKMGPRVGIVTGASSNPVSVMPPMPAYHGYIGAPIPAQYMNYPSASSNMMMQQSQVAPIMGQPQMGYYGQHTMYSASQPAPYMPPMPNVMGTMQQPQQPPQPNNGTFWAPTVQQYNQQRGQPPVQDPFGAL